MTYDLKYKTSEIVCDTMQYSDISQSFTKCVENDIQILEWIRNTDFQPDEELDKKLVEWKALIENYYLQSLIGINEFGIRNVINRGIGYKIILLNNIVEIIRKYRRYG